MNFKIILIAFVCFSQFSWAQDDSPFKSKKLKLNWDNPPAIAVEPGATTPGISYKSILDKDDSYLKKYSLFEKKNETASVLEKKSEFKNPGDAYKDKLNKEIQEGSKVDVFFGKFIVETPRIRLMTRDFADPDGDRVRVILDDVVVIMNITLESAFKTHYIDLKEGDNLLDILALNQGLSGPNTATFAIYDDNGNLITTNDWNLNTGLSAKFFLVYRKTLERK